MGVPLLRRYGRTLRMTAAGAAFKKEVDEMLHRLDDGIASASQAVDPERGTVRLGFQPSLASWLVPLLIRSFRKTHPSVTFSLLEVRGAASLAALESGEADLVVGIRRMDPRRARRLRLMDQPLILALTPDHPFASREVLPLSAVADETFLMLRAESSLGAYARELQSGRVRAEHRFRERGHLDAAWFRRRRPGCRDPSSCGWRDFGRARLAVAPHRDRRGAITGDSVVVGA